MWYWQLSLKDRIFIIFSIALRGHLSFLCNSTIIFPSLRLRNDRFIGYNLTCISVIQFRSENTQNLENKILSRYCRDINWYAMVVFFAVTRPIFIRNIIMFLLVTDKMLFWILCHYLINVCLKNIICQHDFRYELCSWIILVFCVLC